MGVSGLTDWSLTTYAVNFPLVECFATGVPLSGFSKIVVGWSFILWAEKCVAYPCVPIGHLGVQEWELYIL